MRIFKTLIFSAAFCGLTACSADAVDAQVISQETSQTAASQVVSDIAPQLELAPNWAMRADESSIVFKGKQTGDEFSGEFSSFTTEIVFKPDFLNVSRVTAVIDMSAFDAGSSDRNDALPGKEWFSIKKFPEAVFESSEFVATDEGTYEAIGTLTLRGVSLPVTVPFDIEIVDGVATMNSELSLNRSDYGVGQGAWAKGEWVDLEVGLEITIVADAI